jgi:WXG100 family type VII secretion target
MAAGQIRINPEEVDQVAKEFRAKGQESQQIIQTLDSRINNLAGNWDGHTKDRFMQDFAEAKKNMQNFVQLLDNISNALTQIATKFRQTDQA